MPEYGNLGETWKNNAEFYHTKPPSSPKVSIRYKRLADEKLQNLKYGEKLFLAHANNYETTLVEIKTNVMSMFELLSRYSCCLRSVSSYKFCWRYVCLYFVKYVLNIISVEKKPRYNQENSTIFIEVKIILAL